MKINSGNISIYLPNKLKDSSYYSEKPFVVFSNDNFIDKSIYLEFISEIKALFKEADWEKGATGKKRFKYDPYNINDNDLNETILNFINIFSTKEFKQWFRQTHECFYDVGLLGSFFPKLNFIKKLLKIINLISRKLFKLKAFNIYSTQVEFSKIGPGASISPHTDSFTKRMALVFYTPLSELNQDMIKSWGTTFWQAKPGLKPLKSWFSNHKIDQKELRNFYDENEVFTSIDYEANKINGFIKSDLSWHSVEKNNYEENRVAIVINIHDTASTEQDIPIIENIQSALLGKTT
tara:strand:- start:60934 stop:61812 length:879 start_codon:yes stop_codon:yes gene_type:complete